jgi:hypothetical protein
LKDLAFEKTMLMNLSIQEQYNELSFYTLTLQDMSFIHQHIVDAYAAQTADANTKPITLVFALAGLYLCIEKNYTGRQVQQAHMKMAKNKIAWPSIILPEKRGDITVADVLAETPGKQRNDMIHKWCASVWEAFQNNRETITSLTQSLYKL